MTLRGVTAGLWGLGLILGGCYGNPRIGGHDAGDGSAGASGAAGTGGSDTAGNDGAAGVGAGGAAGRGGQAGSVGGSGSAGRGGAAGGAAGGSGGASGVAGVGASGGNGGAGATGAAGSSGGARGGAGGVACSPACDATHACSGGRCLLADAQPCVTASQCASGVCNPFYADVDGDGYGTGQAVGFCTLTAAPIGYATQNGDCCDAAANIALAKLIHPGADFQITTAGGICDGITWDYDCSGAFEKAGTYCGNCTDSPACDCVVAQFADSDCGRHVAYPHCGMAVTAVGITCVNAGGDGPLGCK